MIRITDVGTFSWGMTGLTGKIKQYFMSKTDKLIGLDIGTGFVKAAQVQHKDGLLLLTHLAISELPAEVMDDGRMVNQERLADTIRECIVASRADGKDVIAGLGGSNVFSREITMPVMPRQELAEAIKWGLEEYVPYPADSFYYDFDVLGPSEDKMKLRILLVAAPYEVVNPIMAAVEAAGFRLVAIETEALASARTLQSPANFHEPIENFLLIDMGAQLSQLTIFQQEAPLFTRLVPIGGVQFTQVIMRTMGVDFDKADQLKIKQPNLLQPVDFDGELSVVNNELKLLVHELAREVRRTMDYYITQNNRATIEQLFLTGGASCFKNVLPHLTSQLDITVELHDPLPALRVSSAFEPRFLQYVRPQMTIAIGLAMRGDEL